MPQIPALPAATSVGLSDLLVLQQGPTTKKTTASLVLDLIQDEIQITEAQVTNLTTDLAGKLSVAANLSDVANAATSRNNLGLGPLLNGQLIIGSTGTNPSLATLTAGPGISITNGAGSILINGTGSGIGWNEVLATSASMVADSGYVTNNAGLVTLTLPVTAVFGSAISVIGKGAGGWLIAQNTGQNVQIGSSSTTPGAGGSVASTNRFDSLQLICTTANTTWTINGAGQSAGFTIV